MITRLLKLRNFAKNRFLQTFSQDFSSSWNGFSHSLSLFQYSWCNHRCNVYVYVSHKKNVFGLASSARRRFENKSSIGNFSILIMQILKLRNEESANSFARNVSLSSCESLPSWSFSLSLLQQIIIWFDIFTRWLEWSCLVVSAHLNNIDSAHSQLAIWAALFVEIWEKTKLLVGCDVIRSSRIVLILV